MTAYKPTNYPPELRTTFVFRNAYFRANCNNGDPTISLDNDNATFITQINHTIHSKATYSNSMDSLCYYDILIPHDLNFTDSQFLYYFIVDEIIFLSSQDLSVQVFTKKMGTVDRGIKLFDIDQNAAKFWKNFLFFGGLITFNIPIWSNLTIIGRMEQNPDFQIILDEKEQSNGILMSPFFPDLSDQQSVTYTLSSTSSLKIILSIVHTDMLNKNWSLNIWSSSSSDSETHYTIDDFISNTLIVHGKVLRVKYDAPKNSSGIVLKYEAIPIRKKKPPLWVIGVVIGFAYTSCLLVGIACIIFQKRKNKIRKIERLATKSRNATLYRQSGVNKNAYDSVVPRDSLMINENNLQINFENPIGTGYSSTVYRAQLSGASPLADSLKSGNYRFSDCKVAVKIANSKGRNEELLLEKEKEIMKEIGYFEYVIAMLGWYYYNGTSALVFELADKDLLTHIHGLRDDDKALPVNTSIAVLWQVARGMEHISSLGLIHRDLAARNILLTKNFVAKISDFGLCCMCDENSFYQAGIHKQLPMRWLSIEALTNQLFSEKSDVWAFGVLMYEVFSRGKIPYSSMDLHSMKEFLFDGNRLECPKDADEKIYQVMLNCWEKELGKRLCFEEVVKIFYVFLEQNGSDGYLAPVYDETMKYYNVADI